MFRHDDKWQLVRLRGLTAVTPVGRHGDEPMEVCVREDGDTGSTVLEQVREAPAAATDEELREAAERDAAAQGLARHLDRPMSVLGLVFVLIVLGQSLAEDPRLARGFVIAGWLLWGVFVAEFALRAYLARKRAKEFWRRNWWQLIFLAVPFLRFARAVTLLRFARAGGILSATIRGSRSAGRLLTGRVAWLAVVTAGVILGTAQLLLVTGSYDSFALALHDAALATISGEPLTADDGFAQVLEVALALYSVAVFATLAGALGAYFLKRPEEQPREQPAPRA